MSICMSQALSAMPGVSGHNKRIVISDRNPILAEGMGLILQADSYFNRFRIMPVTESDPLALARMQPDILVLDPWQSPFQIASIAERFDRLCQSTSLIGYCGRIDAAQARSLIDVGFRGIIPKTLQGRDLARIVISVACGGVYLHDCYSTRQDSPLPLLIEGRCNGVDLSEREEEVLRHVALGSSMKEIARLLQISTKTADTYKTRANQKLNLRSRADIVQYAIRSGWMN